MNTALGHRVELDLRDVPASNPWNTVLRARSLISRKVGLIRQIAETCHQAQDPVLFITGLLLSDFSRTMSDGVRITASGAGDSAAAALVSAIGEAAERYCACSYDRSTLVFGTCRELADDAVSPDVLRLFSREQVEGFGPGEPTYFDESSRIRWVWGYSLSERRPRLVPASLVYVNYRPGADEALIGHNASTGLAAGATREEAILSALLENVERDAFTIAWMHRRPGRRIDIDDDELQTMLRVRLWADRPSVDVKVFDLTTDVAIPVAFVVTRRQAETGPVPCQGLASRLSPQRAVRKCIHEAGQTFPVVRNLLAKERDWRPASDFSNVSTFEYHFLTYLKRPELVAPAFAFYDECEDRIALSALADRSTGRVLGDIEYCVAELGRAGYEVIVVDITTEDIAAAGLSVVRVLVPGLVPLHHDHRRPYLGVRRLFDVPWRLEWDRRGWSLDGGFNPLPHPFP
jgi:ribosomal protein S12 methylthiotransferase accessory factor